MADLSRALGTAALAWFAGCAGGEEAFGKGASCFGGEGGLAIETARFSQETDASGLLPRGRLVLELAARCEGLVLEQDADVKPSALVALPDGGEEMRPLAYLGGSASGQALELVVGGPMSAGSVVSFPAGSLRLGGQRSPTTSVVLDNLKLSPAEAALWFKPYVPRDLDLFPPELYGGAEPVRGEAADASLDAASVALSEVLEGGMRTGVLDAERVSALLQWLEDAASGQDARARDIFADSDDVFQPHLMAGLLATAGTVYESAIDVVLVEAAGAGFKFIWNGDFGSALPPGAGAAAFLVEGDARVWVVLNRRHLREPVAAIMPTVGHEILHSDGLVGLQEEQFAKVADAAAWLQMLSRQPELGRLPTFEIQYLNMEALWLLNSGAHAFPLPGSQALPEVLDEHQVSPGASIKAVSFLEAVQQFYPDLPSMPTPANVHAVAVAAALGGNARSATVFDDALLEDGLDPVRVFSGSQLSEALAALDLRLADSLQLAD